MKGDNIYNDELETAARERELIDEANAFLDQLMAGNTRQERIVVIDKFFNKISLIEELELKNRFPADTEELNKLATRAMEFVVREKTKPDLDEKLGEEMWEFVKEYRDFVKEIWTVEDKIFKEKIKNRKTGQPVTKKALPFRRFKRVPTLNYIISGSLEKAQKGLEAARRQQEEETKMARELYLKPLTPEEKERVRMDMKTRPDVILNFPTRYFNDKDFVEEIRRLAIENFPKACKKYYQENGFPLKDAKQKKANFVALLDKKIEREEAKIAAVKGNEGK